YPSSYLRNPSSLNRSPYRLPPQHSSFRHLFAVFNVPPSPYDLRFQIAGIPIRVHPLFWLGALVLGMRLDSATLILWMIVVFCSVLIHELGHALMMRYFGQSPHVVLYLMGGYASPRSEFYSFASTPRLSHGK